LGGVARPLVLEILVARKVLPSGCLAPALDHVLVALAERMLEVQQGHHQSGWQTRPVGIGDAASGNCRDWAKQVRIHDLLARLDLACQALHKGNFDLLPGHAVGQHRQQVMQIDHLVQPVTEKVIGHGAAFKNSQKTGSIGYLFESSDYPDSPHIARAHEGCRGFAVSTTSRFVVVNMFLKQLKHRLKKRLRLIFSVCYCYYFCKSF
jgi:hypothetical protein